MNPSESLKEQVWREVLAAWSVKPEAFSLLDLVEVDLRLHQSLSPPLAAALQARPDLIQKRAMAPARLVPEKDFEWLRLAQAQKAHKDREGARRSVARVAALQEQADNGDLLWELARLQLWLGEKEAARRSITRLIHFANQKSLRAARENELSSAVALLVDVGDLVAATLLALSIPPDWGFQETALREVAVATAKAGKRREAQHLFAVAAQGVATIQSAIGRARSSAWLAGAQWQVGERQGARQNFAKAQQAAFLVSEAYQKAEVLGELAVAHAEAGDVAGAKRALTLVHGDDEKEKAQATVAVALVPHREIRLAKQLARMIKTPRRRGSALLQIALAQGRQKDLSGCRQTCTEAQPFVPTSEVVGVLSAVGDFPGAVRTARTISEIGARGAALCDCLRALLMDPPVIGG